jgi:hypothetical protein
MMMTLRNSSSSNRKEDSASPKRHKKSEVAVVVGAAASSSLINTTTIAVSRLQRVWRWSFSRLVTRKLAIDFLRPRGRPGVTIEHVKSISFEHLVVFLREKEVIASTNNSLQRIHKLCISRHGSPPSASSGNVNARVYLAAFMIAYRPTHVFESMGALETALYDSAYPLTTRFQSILECIARVGGAFQAVPVELTTGFLEMLHLYLDCFKAWKVPDEVNRFIVVVVVFLLSS